MTDLNALQQKISQEIRAEFQAYLALEKSDEQESTRAREQKKKITDTHLKDLRPDTKKYEAYNKELIAYTEKQITALREKQSKGSQAIQSLSLEDVNNLNLTSLAGGNGAQVLIPASSMILSSDEGGETGSISAEALTVYNNSTMKPWAFGRGGGWGCFDSGIGSTSQWVEFGFWFRPEVTRFYNLYPLNVLRGYFLTIASDEWYDCKHARVDINVHTNVWQYNWKGVQVHHLVGRSGDNINVNSRFDRNQYTPHNALLAGGDWAYLRVSVQLYVYARGGGSYAELNFNAGNANYIQCPHAVIF